MKKTFVKPEMKSHRLRANNILVGSGPCPPVKSVQECPDYCAYNCPDNCYSLTGGICDKHSGMVND